MKLIIFISLCLATLMFNMSCAGEEIKNELTGTFHKEQAKDPAYLEIDGSGFIPRIIITGDKLKDVADGARIWIQGRIETSQYGSPDKTKQEDQQAATQWFIVFHVEKYKLINTSFEKPVEK